MKTLHKYVTGQILATLLLTVSVFAFVVLLAIGIKDVLPLLFTSHVSPWLVIKAIGLLLPFACVYALPIGFITAALLMFGRFSADHELTAARASGISLLSLISPVLLLSLLCCALSAWLNMDIGPRSRVAFINMKYSLLGDLAKEIPEGQIIHDFPGFNFYVGKNNGGEMDDILIYRIENGTNTDAIIHAAHGHFEPDLANNQLKIHLSNAQIIYLSQQNMKNTIFNFSSTSQIISTNLMQQRLTKPKVSDMTFIQLQQELHELEQLNFSAAGTNSPAELNGFKRLNMSLATNATPAETEAFLRTAEKTRAQQIEQVRVTMHFEVAFSFACFSFALVGIPLGIRVHRRETNIGIFIALMLVAVYYGFVMLGQSLSGHPELHPHLIFWIPNFLFQGIGAVLLWRANRGI